MGRSNILVEELLKKSGITTAGELLEGITTENGITRVKECGDGYSIEYAAYPDNSYIFEVHPDERIIFVLSNLGEDQRHVAEEWSRRMGELKRCGAVNINELASMFNSAISVLAGICDWLINEVKKLSSDKLTPSLQAKILSMLSGEE